MIIEALVSQIEQRGDQGVRQRVDILAAPGLHCDEPALEKALEVVRGIRRAEGAVAGKIASRAWPVLQRQEQAQPSWIGKAAE